MSDTTLKNLQSRAVYFDDVSTVDLGIYVKSIDFAPPAVKSDNVEVPGMNGNYDFTDILTGYPTFENRKIKVTFFDPQSVRAMYQRYGKVLDLLHGKTFSQIIFSQDKGYFWSGRVSLQSLKYSKGIAEYTAEIDAYPYKRCVQTSNESWLWDTFSFVSGYIGNSEKVYQSSSSNTQTFLVEGTEHCEFDVINRAEIGCKLSFNGGAYVECKHGKTHFTQLLKPGINKFTSDSTYNGGAYNVSVDWREGHL